MMTTATATYTGSGLTNDTAYRAAGSAWSGLLDTLGLTKTAATGQPNWTTITTSTTTSYEQREFTDATGTIYLQVTYTLSSTALGVSFQWGTSPPAAANGFFGQTIGGSVAITATSNAVANVKLWGAADMSGAIGWFTLALQNTSTNSNGDNLYVLQRSANAASGWVVTGCVSGASTVQVGQMYSLNVYSAPGAAVGGNKQFSAAAGYAGSVSPDVQAFVPQFRVNTGQPLEDAFVLLLIPRTELSYWATHSFTVSGTTRTYLAATTSIAESGGGYAPLVLHE